MELEAALSSVKSEHQKKVIQCGTWCMYNKCLAGRGGKKEDAI